MTSYVGSWSRARLRSARARTRSARSSFLDARMWARSAKHANIFQARVFKYWGWISMIKRYQLIWRDFAHLGYIWYFIAFVKGFPSILINSRYVQMGKMIEPFFEFVLIHKLYYTLSVFSTAILYCKITYTRSVRTRFIFMTARLDLSARFKTSARHGPSLMTTFLQKPSTQIEAPEYNKYNTNKNKHHALISLQIRNIKQNWYIICTLKLMLKRESKKQFSG